MVKLRSSGSFGLGCDCTEIPVLKETFLRKELEDGDEGGGGGEGHFGVPELLGKAGDGVGNQEGEVGVERGELPGGGWG